VRTRYQVLLFVGGIVLFVLAGGLILDWYIKPHTSGQKKDLVQALGLLTAGVAGAVGIFFTWRGQRITQESLQDTRENSEENLRLAREGQITDRFTRAIDELGATDEASNKKLEIRLGGIYALERIAWDSLAMEHSQGRDYSTVMEVLTAYVRENSPQATAEADEGAKEPLPPELRRPTVNILATDILAILDVLRRLQAHVSEKYHWRLPWFNLDLHEANLQGADLKEAALQGAVLQGAALREANLTNAKLNGAELSYADLQGADLQGANFLGASGITEDQIKWTVGSNETNLPEDLNPPELWSKSYEEQVRIVREHTGG
jgi:hypothetical protein